MSGVIIRAAERYLDRISPRIAAHADLGSALVDFVEYTVEAARREEGDVDTIGGLIFSLLGHVPVRGEVIPAFAGYEMEVLDADPRRIRRVRVVRLRQHQRRGAGRREASSAPPRLPAPGPVQPGTPEAEPVNV